MAVASLCPRRVQSVSRVRATIATRGRCTRHGTRIHQQSNAMASLKLLLPLASPLLLPLVLLGARMRLLLSCLVAMMMAFFPLLTSQPVFLLILTSGDQDLPPGARVRLKTASSTPVSRATPSTLGAHALSFFPLPSPSPPLKIPSPQQPSVLASPPLRSPLLPSLPSLLASLHSLLLHLCQVAQCTVKSPILADIARPVTMCLCVGLSSIFPICLPPPTLPSTLKEPD